jgi:hypothetical protein
MPLLSVGFFFISNLTQLVGCETPCRNILATHAVCVVTLKSFWLFLTGISQNLPFFNLDRFFKVENFMF